MTHPLTIAIDPGKEALAWVLGRGRIEGAGLIEGLTLETIVPRVRASGLADVAAAFGRPVQVYVEKMLQRPGQKAHTALAKANDLMELAFIGGGLACTLAYFLGGSVHPVTYHTWCGSASEAQVQNRLVGEGGALHPLEVIALDLKRYRSGIRHNLYDAAGIFCFATGRLRPGSYV